MSSSEVTANLRDADTAITQALEQGLLKAAEHVLDVSQRQVPVDEGDLKRSGRSGRDRELRVKVGYKDPAAVIVHENMQARHDRGNAKYLENAMNSERDEALDIIVREVRTDTGL